jgi:hypothetical protein
LALTAATDDQSSIQFFVLPPLFQFEWRGSRTAGNVGRSRLAVTDGSLSGQARRLFRRGDYVTGVIPDVVGAQFWCGPEQKCGDSGDGDGVSD